MELDNSRYPWGAILQITDFHDKLEKHDSDLYNPRDGVTVRLTKLETNVNAILKIGWSIVICLGLNFVASLYHVVAK